MVPFYDIAPPSPNQERSKITLAPYPQTISGFEAGVPIKRRWPTGLGRARRFLGILTIGGLVLGTSAVGASRSELPERLQLYNLVKSGTYLILFQNNAELRPSGGFLGSFATVNLDDGKPRKVYVDTNIYKRDTAFVARASIPLPEPLKRINHDERWSMRDSNWAPDFAEAAQTVREFYVLEGGERVDGVIALTTTFVEELLKISGPIELPEHGLTVTTENFYSEVQYRVEKGYFAKEENKQINEPKTLIRDLIPPLAEKLYRTNPISTYQFLTRMARQKQIQFWFAQSAAQQLVESWGWAGRIPATGGNFFATFNAVLGQAKSSRSVFQSVELTESQQPQSTLVTAVITRSHRGTNIWPDGNDSNYLTVVIPKEAKLIKLTQNGKDILDTQTPVEVTPTGHQVIQKVTTGERYAKQLVGFWMDTPVGATSVSLLTYSLPPLPPATYIQKQPGSLHDSIRLIRDGRVLYDNTLQEDMEL